MFESIHNALFALIHTMNPAHFLGVYVFVAGSVCYLACRSARSRG